MHDVRDPQLRIGSDAIDAAGFKFLPNVTAVSQLESRGITTSAVTEPFNVASEKSPFFGSFDIACLTCRLR